MRLWGIASSAYRGSHTRRRLILCCLTGFASASVSLGHLGSLPVFAGVSRLSNAPSAALTTTTGSPNAASFVSCAFGSSASTISGGLDHFLSVVSGGNVVAWGDNIVGQQGNNTGNNNLIATAVPNLPTMTAVAAGYNHSLALQSNGAVWAWGDNTSGELGQGFVPGPQADSQSSTPVPVQLPAGVTITAIAAGFEDSLALDTNGNVWTWGYNDSGQLGTGLPNVGHSTGTPAEIMTLPPIQAIAAGSRHSVALDVYGIVWTWGYNQDGELGNGASGANSPDPNPITFSTSVSAIASGSTANHSLAVLADTNHSLWAWGLNDRGQLGDGTTTNRSQPTPVSPGSTGGLNSTPMNNAIALSAGAHHTLAALTPQVQGSANMWAWGTNTESELGQSTSKTYSSVPVFVANTGEVGSIAAVAAGGTSSIEVNGSNTAYGFGDNTAGELGINGPPINQNVTQVASPTRLTCPNGRSPLESVGPPATYHNPLDCWLTGYPVDCATGNFWHQFTDLKVPGRGASLDFGRTYNSLAAWRNGPLGFGWTDSYTASLDIDASGNVYVHDPNGAMFAYQKTGPSTYQSSPWIFSTLVRNSDGTYTFTLKDQTHFVFSSTGQLLKETDRNNYATTLAYSGGQLSSVTDPAGRSLAFTYGANGKISTIADSASRTVSFTYDSNQNLVSATDVAKGVTKFTYDGNHRMLTMVDPNGGTLTNSYDSFGRVSAQTDPLQRTTKFGYGSTSTQITDPKGNVTVQQYGSSRELLSVTRGAGTPQSATWSFTYDPSTLGVSSITDPDNHVTQTTYDARGNILSFSDGLHRVTSYTYDSLNDVLTITDPLNVTATNTYDASGDLLTISKPLTTSGTSAVTKFQYDPNHAGDLVAETDANGKVSQFAYDQYGDQTSIIDPLGDTTTMAYDGIGRLTSKVPPRGNVKGATPASFATSYTYNAFGDPTSVTDPLQHRVSFGYDANRNLLTSTDSNSHTVTNSYDADNERTQTVRADGSSQKTSFDGNGNVISEVDGLGNTWSYAYDPLNRPVSVTDPLNRITAYAYDGAGNRTSMVDALGRTTTYGYDAANQLVSVSYSDGKTPNFTYTYDADGQRQTMTDGTGTSSYTFDSLHRLTKSTNGAGQTTGYGYDLAGHLTTISYPGATSRVVNRAYDAAGRLISVGDWLGHTTTFTYDPDSDLTVQNDPNGVAGKSSYDAADQLTQITDSAGKSTFLSLNYSRNNLGQITNDGSRSYGYDAINRLTSTATSTSSPSFNYDAADRLSSSYDSTTDTTISYSYDTADQLGKLSYLGFQPRSSSFTYDAAGNRITRADSNNGGSTTYSYDQENRLIARSTSGGAQSQYAYAGDGLRASKTVSGVPEAFTWDVSQQLPLLIQDGGTSFINGPRGLAIEQITAGGTVSYLHQDQLGSTRAITNASGTVVGSYTYDGWGNASWSGTVTTPLQFAGQYADAESGFTYMRARYYDPYTAQFISDDPLVAKTRHPYTYAQDDPANLSDPSGQDANNTVGLCQTTSAQFGAAGWMQNCVVTADGHHYFWARTYTVDWSVLVKRDTGAPPPPGLGAGSPSLSTTVSLQIANNGDPHALAGPFLSGGGSGDVGLSLGAEAAIGCFGSQRVIVWGPAAGVGFGGGEVHGAVTYTVLTPINDLWQALTTPF